MISDARLAWMEWHHCVDIEKLDSVVFLEKTHSDKHKDFKSLNKQTNVFNDSTQFSCVFSSLFVKQEVSFAEFDIYQIIENITG